MTLNPWIAGIIVGLSFIIPPLGVLMLIGFGYYYYKDHFKNLAKSEIDKEYEYYLYLEEEYLKEKEYEENEYSEEILTKYS